MPVKTKGPTPREFSQDQTKALATILTKTALDLSADITKAMPVGIAGELQRSWTPYPATPTKLVAGVSSSSAYFLPVEVGRKPGKGISQEGQQAVTLWARRKLGKSEDDARGFAYLLSQKYKREGRPAQGLIGLARPGDRSAEPRETPIPGSILDKAFKNLENDLTRI